jgi:hypothetical protein
MFENLNRYVSCLTQLDVHLALTDGLQSPESEANEQPSNRRRSMSEVRL